MSKKETGETWNKVVSIDKTEHAKAICPACHFNVLPSVQDELAKENVPLIWKCPQCRLPLVIEQKSENFVRIQAELRY